MNGRGLEIIPDQNDPTKGRACWQGQFFPCALGRAGIIPAGEKREGDGKTPLGRFAMRRLLYRADRVKKPETGLPVSTIGGKDGWCDAPGDAHYNQPVSLPYGASAERLWRDDAIYNLVVILGHNDNPPVAGLGSAIFLHIVRDNFSPTAGCVALKQRDLLTILQDCDIGAYIDIRAPKIAVPTRT